MKKLFQISAAAVALLSASAAFAQMPPDGRGPKRPRPDFSKSAPDMKGITRAQALAHAAERFDAADTNKDGFLSRDELHQAREQKMHDKRLRRGPPPPIGSDGAPPMRGEHGGPRGQGATPPPPVDEQR